MVAADMANPETCLVCEGSTFATSAGLCSRITDLPLTRYRDLPRSARSVELRTFCLVKGDLFGQLESIDGFSAAPAGSAVVSGGGVGGGVPDQLLGGGQVDSGVEKVADEGAAQIVWGVSSRSGGITAPGEDVCDGLPGHGGRFTLSDARSTGLAQWTEQGTRSSASPGQPAMQSSDRLRRQVNLSLLAAFAQHGETSI